jgi:hypothetical protein
MEKKLELISSVFFVLLLITMFIVLGVETPIPFDVVGKSLLGILVISMLGTIVPLIISKANSSGPYIRR